MDRILKRIKKWYSLIITRLFAKVTLDQLEMLQKEPPIIKKEERLACEHKSLTKVWDIWYRCPKCGILFAFPNGMAFDQSLYQEMIKNIGDLKWEKK